LVEVLVHNDQVKIVAVIEQEITFFKRFIVTGYLVLATLPGNLFEDINNVVSTIVKEIGMSTGACHLELKLVNNSWKLIEINPRISGGAMNQMIKVSCGINLVRETVRLALGEEPNLKKSHSHYVFTQYLIASSPGILKKVTGRNRASSYPGVTDVYVKYSRGSEIGPPLSMGKRCGYVMAVGDSPEEAKTRAKTAASEIRFHLESPE
ncbi:MAG: ATP-grasp domain-containing protein, partial [Bacillota bacterium]